MASSKIANFTLRNHRPGDMGFIISRHGAIYSREYNWDERFEALVARVAADFLDNFDSSCEACWIAERQGAGDFLGCVMLVKNEAVESGAKLRLLLVEPGARGLGLGRELVHQAIQFARACSYSEIALWTHSVLASARRIYENEGFRLIQEKEYHGFGKTLTSQNWRLVLVGPDQRSDG